MPPAMPAVLGSVVPLVAKFVTRARASNPLVATPNGPPNFSIPPPTIAPVFPNFLVKTSVILAPLNMSATFCLEAALFTSLSLTTSVCTSPMPAFSPTAFLAIASASDADITRARLADTPLFILIRSSALLSAPTRAVANCVACF